MGSKIIRTKLDSPKLLAQGQVQTIRPALGLLDMEAQTHNTGLFTHLVNFCLFMQKKARAKFGLKNLWHILTFSRVSQAS